MLDSDSYERNELLFLNMYHFWEDFVYNLDNCLSSCLNSLALHMWHFQCRWLRITWRFSLLSSWERSPSQAGWPRVPGGLRGGLRDPLRHGTSLQISGSGDLNWSSDGLTSSCWKWCSSSPRHSFSLPERNMQVFHRDRTLWSLWSSNPLRSWPKLWH